MIGIVIFLSILGVIFITSTIFFFIVSKKAMERAKRLELLFLDTLDDMQNSAEIFHQLVNRRSLLSDDPDVQRIKQVFGVTLDILGEYIINGKQLTSETQEEEQEEQAE